MEKYILQTFDNGKEKLLATDLATEMTLNPRIIDSLSYTVLRQTLFFIPQMIRQADLQSQKNEDQVDKLNHIRVLDETFGQTPYSERLKNIVYDNTNEDGDSLQLPDNTSGMKEQMEIICEKISSWILYKVS